MMVISGWHAVNSYDRRQAYRADMSTPVSAGTLGYVFEFSDGCSWEVKHPSGGAAEHGQSSSFEAAKDMVDIKLQSLYGRGCLPDKPLAEGEEDTKTLAWLNTSELDANDLCKALTPRYIASDSFEEGEALRVESSGSGWSVVISGKVFRNLPEVTRVALDAYCAGWCLSKEYYD